jgi:hypothetical protein
MRSPKSPKRKQNTKAAEPLARPGSKLAKLLAFMSRPQGATVEELVKATGWQKHTVRGAISGAVRKKLRQVVTVLTSGDRRAYAIGKQGKGKPAVRPVAKPAKAAAPKPVAAKPAAE